MIHDGSLKTLTLTRSVIGQFDGMARHWQTHVAVPHAAADLEHLFVTNDQTDVSVLAARCSPRRPAGLAYLTAAALALLLVTRTILLGASLCSEK